MSKGKGWGQGLGRLIRGVDRLVQGAENARKVMKKQRDMPAYAAPFDLILTEGILKLRHYPGTQPTPDESAPNDAQANDEAPASDEGNDSNDSPPVGTKAPLLFVPPLMVTAEIYDISPELSAVAWLQGQGVDVWLADFGKPEQEDGWNRTLDDHVVAIDHAIEAVAKATGQPVHVAGYSQGGMFAYQAAAYRKSANIASLITFGSPVDLRRNMPINIHEALAGRLLTAAQTLLKFPINELKGLPGILNSYGFKLVSPRQEIKHLLKVVGMLHDEEALARILPTRRFLGGEGFIAWPGPALRKFFDEYIVNNRLLSGGFVIKDRSASLTDLTMPILYFVGEKDDIAKPAAVRAIRQATTHDEVYEHPLEVGHFGLVVGSKALAEVWPQVLAWIRWHEGAGPRPHFPHDDKKAKAASAETPPTPTFQAPPTPPPFGPDPHRHMGTGTSPWKPLKDLASGLAGGAWQQLGEVSLGVTDTLHTMRWQLPRMAQVLGMEDGAKHSMGRTLQKQAREIPEVPFFFWRGQVHTYEESNVWVEQLAVRLHEFGVKPRQRIAVAMQHHPGYLLTVTALSRLGAVPVLLPPQHDEAAISSAIQVCEIEGVVVDGHHLPRLQALPTPPPCYLFTPQAAWGLNAPTPTITPGVFPLTRSEVPWPSELEANPGAASDLAMILFTAGTTGPPKAVQITNRRWGIAALATAASCTLTPNDTVYCCVPLHQSAGILLNVGGALVSGARLALVPTFSSKNFWPDVRRLGVTVAFHTGEQARALLATPALEKERRHSLRLLVGNGMAEETWKGLKARYQGLQIVEFYGTAEGNVTLVNAPTGPVGAVGQPLIGDERDLVLVQYDFARRALQRDEEGHCILSPPGEPGVLLSRVDQVNTPFHFAPYVDATLTDANIARGIFTPHDAWFVSGDWMRRSSEGHYHFIDAIHKVVRHNDAPTSPRQVGLALQQAPGVAMAAACFTAHKETEKPLLVGLIELQGGSQGTLDGAAIARILEDALPKHAHPDFIKVVPRLHTTPNYRLDLREYEAQPVGPGDDDLYQYHAPQQAYVLT